MKGLSLWQPWATLIALGEKRIETRSRRTNYRGPLAIHATHKCPASARDLCFEEPFREVLTRHGIIESPSEKRRVLTFPIASIIAVAEVIGCVPVEEITRMSQALLRNEIAFGNYTPGRFAWVLAEVKALRQPVHCSGARGLWTVPEDVRDVVEELTPEIG